MADFDLSRDFIPALHKPSSLLPIARHRNSILYLIETYPVVIVVGQTGSGKTTQIPQFLHQAGWCEQGKMVAVTQVGEYREFANINHDTNSQEY
jgi:ATP-dependent RNA helicase DDX35